MLAHYLEIAAPGRIVYAYVMHTNGKCISSSLVTVELIGDGAKTFMTYTEQAVFGDISDGDIGESGTGLGFERLRDVLMTTPEAPEVPLHPS